MQVYNDTVFMLDSIIMKKLLVSLSVAGLLFCGLSSAHAEDWTSTVENILKKYSNNVYSEPNNTGAQIISAQELAKYQVDNEEFLNIIESIEKPGLTQVHAVYNGGISSSSDVPIEDLGRVELPWYNGNYLVWNTYTNNKGTNCLGEYDSDKEKRGTVLLIEERGNVVAYEYLPKSDWYVPVESVFIYYKNDKAAFLYDGNKNLLMYQINGQKKIEKADIIKNPDFMNQVIPKFNNPEKYIIPYVD